ncbi:hypothetical protein ScPMuIL_012708 [Solemya velum]
MLTTTWVALVLGFWSSLYLLDAFLKSQKWSRRQYVHFLEYTGLSVSICQLRCYATCLNRTFLRVGQNKPKYLKIWFTAGVFFGMFAMLISICILTLMVFNTLRRNTADQQQVLTPVMPGVNLPTSQVSYYLLTLLVCGILHELGHAIAAVREQVRVNGFGLFLLIVYPGAYVDLSSEHLQIISPLRQLRVYCAGVWHNFIIVVIALLILLSLPWSLVPFYTMGNAVVITQVTQNSAVSGPRGLAVGDSVTSISGCRVTSLDDWSSCIGVSIHEDPLGHCLTKDLIKEFDTSAKDYNHSKLMDCCNMTSNTHLCFMYHTKSSPHNKFACLPARMTTDRPMCKFQSDCYLPKVETACVYPALDNETKLLRIVHGNKPPLLFLGHPLDLHYSVHVSNYVPSFKIVPLNLPYIVETFCKYLISLSGALVILNVVPCYALDGQYICYALIELSLQSFIPDRDIRGLIYTVFIFYGTLLLAANVVIALWTLFS